MQNYTAEIHEIQTEDGYFLAAHRIPFGRNNSQLSHRPAVLLFHSLFTSSDSWILRGTKDLGKLQKSWVGEKVRRGFNRS